VANQHEIGELLAEVNVLLVDSIKKDIEQYNAEADLWNTEVQSKIADRIANKMNNVINNVRFQESEVDEIQEN
tara:strand:+ start:1149 stop:1367 length:219 start_codon:yes stop_codon:yes gene_type:complete